jgi:hypothetical protein
MTNSLMTINDQKSPLRSFALRALLCFMNVIRLGWPLSFYRTTISLPEATGLPSAASR